MGYKKPWLLHGEVHWKWRTNEFPLVPWCPLYHDQSQINAKDQFLDVYQISPIYGEKWSTGFYHIWNQVIRGLNNVHPLHPCTTFWHHLASIFIRLSWVRIGGSMAAMTSSHWDWGFSAAVRKILRSQISDFAGFNHPWNQMKLAH